MKKSNILKTVIFTGSLIFGSIVASNPAFAPSATGVCNAPTTAGIFKVTITIVDDNGNPSISFTNYTLDFATKPLDPKTKKGPKAGSPFIYICLKGSANPVFDHSADALTWKSNPYGPNGREFTEAVNPNGRHNLTYVIRNRNDTQGTYRYTVTVTTASFGVMEIDPRIENGGGGTQP